MSEDAPSTTLFARRLEHLFQTVHPKDRGPYTHEEVAAAINKAAGKHVISHSYVWQLRRGKRDNPGMNYVTALAAFFGVTPMYFFADENADPDSVPPEFLQAFRDDAVREVALAAAGLSDATLRAIRTMIQNARQFEGLPDATAPGDTH